MEDYRSTEKLEKYFQFLKEKNITTVYPHMCPAGRDGKLPGDQAEKQIWKIQNRNYPICEECSSLNRERFFKGRNTSFSVFPLIFFEEHPFQEGFLPFLLERNSKLQRCLLRSGWSLEGPPYTFFLSGSREVQSDGL